MVAAHQHKAAVAANFQVILRSVQQRGDAGTFNHKVCHVTASDLPDALHHVLIFAVDGGRCAKALGHFQLGIIHVNGNQPGQIVTGQCLNAPHAHGAAAQHHTVIGGLGGGGAQHGQDALLRFAQSVLRVNVVSQLFAAGFWGGAVLGKAAKAAGHGADFIPYLEFGAAGTQLDHGTGELMSQLVGVAHKVQVAVPEIQFPVAQAAAGNLHHYFARPRFFLYFVDLKAMRLHQKCAFELHCFPHFLFCCVISFFNL